MSPTQTLDVNVLRALPLESLVHRFLESFIDLGDLGPLHQFERLWFGTHAGKVSEIDLVQDLGKYFFWRKEFLDGDDERTVDVDHGVDGGE